MSEFVSRGLWSRIGQLHLFFFGLAIPFLEIVKQSLLTPVYWKAATLVDAESVPVGS